MQKDQNKLDLETKYNDLVARLEALFGDRIDNKFGVTTQDTIAKYLRISPPLVSQLLSKKSPLSSYDNVLNTLENKEKEESLERLKGELEECKSTSEKYKQDFEECKSVSEKYKQDFEESKSTSEKYKQDFEESKSASEKYKQGFEESKSASEKYKKKINKLWLVTTVMAIAIILRVSLPMIKNWLFNDKLTLLLQTHPKNYIQIKMIEEMAKKIKLLSNDQIAIDVELDTNKNYAGYTLEVFEKDTEHDMLHSVMYYFPSNNQIDPTIFQSSIPFGLNYHEHEQWLEEEGQLLWDKQIKKRDLVVFPLGNTGQQLGGWFFKKIDSIEDFKKLHIRIYGLGGMVLKRAVEGNIELDMKEPFPTAADIKRKANQYNCNYAFEYINAAVDEKIGISKIAKDSSLQAGRPSCSPTLYINGWHEPNTTFGLYIKKAALKKLNEKQQILLKTIIQNYNIEISKRYEIEGRKQLYKWINDQESNSFKIDAFNHEVLKKLKIATTVVLRSARENGDDDFNKTYDSYMKFYKKVRGRDFADTSYIPNFLPIPSENFKTSDKN